MDNQNTINRRALLRAAPGAAVAITIMPGIAAAANPTALQEAFATYHEAKGESDAAWSERADLEDAWDTAKRAGERIMVPRLPLPDGSSPSGWGELAVLKEDGVRTEIARAHEQLRKIHLGRWTAALVPNFHAALGTEIDASEARALAALDEALAEQRRRETAFGLTAAQERCERADSILCAATLAVGRCRPVTLAEAEAKTEWLLSLEWLASLNSDFDLDDLRASAGGVA